MNMFQIDDKKMLFGGAALCCAASLLTACCSPCGVQADSSAMTGETVSAVLSTYTPDHDWVPYDTPFSSHTLSGEDMSVSASDGQNIQSPVRILSYDGVLGDYSFRDCNETQLFGDYTLSLVSYEGEEYLMLSQSGLALLAREDGSDAKLYYDSQWLSLPGSCNFCVGSDLLELYEGDFTGDGSRQLAIISPVETGSGIYIENLTVVNLDTMSVIPLYSDVPSCEEFICRQFASHFDSQHVTVEYRIYDYIHYAVRGDQILVSYGASDPDGNYLCFLNGVLTAQNGSLVLGEMRFLDTSY